MKKYIVAFAQKFNNPFLFLFMMSSSNIHALFDYDQAIWQAQKNDYKASKETLKKVLVHNPGSGQVLYDLGVSSFKDKEFDKALSYFSKAAQDTAASSLLQEQAHFNAGNAHVQLKQLQEAIDAYDRALALNPDNKHALHNKEIVKKMIKEQKKQQQQKQDQENKKENKDQDSQDQDQKDSGHKDESKDSSRSANHEKNNEQQNDNKNPHTSSPKNSPEKSQADKDTTNEQKQKQEKSDQAGQQAPANTNGGKERQPAQSAAPGQNDSSAQKKLSPALAQLLHEQDKKDAHLNKQMIKAQAGTKGGSAHDYNCW